MAPSPAPVRSAAKHALVAAIAQVIDDPDVTVMQGFPGRNLGRSAIWIGDVTGEVSYPFMMGGPKIRQDDFVVTIFLHAGAPGLSIEETDFMVEALWAQIDAEFADVLLTLNDLDGVMQALEGGGVKGPIGELTDEGATSYMSVEVSVKARYS